MQWKAGTQMPTGLMLIKNGEECYLFHLDVTFSQSSCRVMATFDSEQIIHTLELFLHQANE